MRTDSFSSLCGVATTTERVRGGFRVASHGFLVTVADAKTIINLTFQLASHHGMTVFHPLASPTKTAVVAMDATI